MDEPVAYINVEDRILEWAKPTRWETPTVVKMDKVPLYVKKEWVGLTEEERLEAENGCFYMDAFELTLYAVKIEDKLWEKNGG